MRTIAPTTSWRRCVALKKDPFVDAGQVRVTASGCVAQLTGLVPTETERARTEDDAWCIFRVDDGERDQD